MSKRFNPFDYNLVANPALKKTNPPFRFVAIFISFALLIAAIWYFFPPKIRIADRHLGYNGDRISAVAQAINDSSKFVSVTVQFIIGYQFIGAKGESRVLQLGSHNASYTLEPQTATRISSDFTLPPATMPTQVDVQITGSKME